MAATGPSHDELRDQASLYVVGALPPGEAAAFERHLTTCPECMAEVQALRPVTDLLAHAVPQHKPPIDLRNRVLAAAVRDVERDVRVVDSRADRIQASSGTRSSSLPGLPGLPGLLPWLLAAASLVLAAGLGVYALQLRGRIDALDSDLQAALESASNFRRQLIEVEQTATRAQQVAAVIAAPDLARIDLVGQKTAPNAAARGLWTDSSDRLVFTALNLPPLAPGRGYQVWVIPPGVNPTPISAGMIRPDAEGRAETVVPTPPGMPPPGVIAVTDEPEAGSLGPTTDPFLAGKAVPAF